MGIFPDEVLVIFLTNLVAGADVRMIERRGSLRLTPEPLAALFVAE